MIGNSNPFERGLLPYPVMLAATKDNLYAMRILVRHYVSYIACLSIRKVHDEYGSTYYEINEDMCERLQTKLRVVLQFYYRDSERQILR